LMRKLGYDSHNGEVTEWHIHPNVAESPERPLELSHYRQWAVWETPKSRHENSRTQASSSRLLLPPPWAEHPEVAIMGPYTWYTETRKTKGNICGHSDERHRSN
jgi:hypothetical protein